MPVHADTGAQTPGLSKRGRRLSRVLSAGCLLAIVVAPLAVVWLWATADAAALYRSLSGGGMAVDAARLLAPVDPWQRAAGAGLSLIPVGLSMMALARARRCLDRFAGGVCFDPAVVTGLRGFAGWSALSVAVGLVLQAPLSALVSLNNPPGERFVSLGIGSEQIYSLFFAGLVWLIAAVMAQAVTIARENAEFV